MQELHPTPPNPSQKKGESYLTIWTKSIEIPNFHLVIKWKTFSYNSIILMINLEGVYISL